MEDSNTEPASKERDAGDVNSQGTRGASVATVGGADCLNISSWALVDPPPGIFPNSLLGRIIGRIIGWIIGWIV